MDVRNCRRCLLRQYSLKVGVAIERTNNCQKERVFASTECMNTMKELTHLPRNRIKIEIILMMPIIIITSNILARLLIHVGHWTTVKTVKLCCTCLNDGHGNNVVCTINNDSNKVHLRMVPVTIYELNKSLDT